MPLMWSEGYRRHPGKELVEFVNVRRQYGTLVALDEINFRLHQGELAFLVGRSGAGKSTMLRLINAEVPPTDGMLWVEGLPLHKLPRSKLPDLRRGVGVVFQDYKLLPKLTAAENVAYALQVTDLRVPRGRVRQLALEQLEAVGLGDRGASYPHQLSGGQQQRLAIARALVSHPPILLADEPTGNLDRETAGQIMGLLESIAATGTAVLVATHDPDIMRALERRVVFLADGKIKKDMAAPNRVWVAK